MELSKNQTRACRGLRGSYCAMILQGDCLIKLKELPDNSVDSIITDPPYELGFMGKGWDNTGIANNKEMWKECLRVLKPGAYLLSFGGTRTYHRMACAIEDAGFEIRDCIEWVYGSGFPKSLNIGKAVDKLQGNEREVIGESWDMPDLRDVGAKSKDACGINKLSFGQVQDAERKVMQLTKGNSEWEGWGTALKPSHEPIVLARKPLSEKSVVENVLKWGTGGINIDESRVEHNEDCSKASFRHAKENVYSLGFKKHDNIFPEYNIQGRFPANLIHDGSEEVLREFEKAGISKSIASSDLKLEPNYLNKVFGKGMEGLVTPENQHNDSGTPARFFKTCEYTEEDYNYPPFFYTAKASKSERNEGCDELEEKETHSALNTKNGAGVRLDGNESARHRNNHPTVKPLKLMEYLIKMVTPKGGIVLDPFAGSGTTLVAAKKLGYKYIGIELTEEYLPIINARLSAIKPQEQQTL